MPRPTCPTCLRAQSACMCRWITPTLHSVRVLILQHPMEVTQAKGSGQLLHLSLQRSQLLVGEQFDALQSQTVLAHQRAILLYPSTCTDTSLLPAAVVPSEWLQDPASLCLVVLDATWRKSRKMLHRNLWLQQLPRMALHAPPASRYRIALPHTQSAPRAPAVYLRSHLRCAGPARGPSQSVRTTAQRV
jgi:DTW domain-containing protein